MKPVDPVQKTGVFLSTLRPVRLFLPLSLAFGGWQMAHAEDQLDYRYEYYNEDNNRMKIETHSVHFEQKIIDAIIAQGDLTYDGISGSSPVGTVSSGKADLSPIKDIRRAESIDLVTQFGRNTFTPGFSHSLESDYESYALSLNDAIDFNDKNTTLQLGFSHNFDSALGDDNVSPRVWYGKQSTEGIIGISQLLSPKTIFTAAFTFGNDSGYLSDPYRRAVIEDQSYTPAFIFSVPDKRPSHRNKEVAYTSLTYFVEPLNASVEGSYRFFHDSYGIFSHTVDLSWHQWLGTHLMLEPSFRFSEQSAADFYTTGFPAPFVLSLITFNPVPPPGIYSSDYRLSELYTLDYGLQATVLVNSHLRFIAGYHRYEMHGLDNVTVASMYPKANIFSIGLSILW
jgi:hypothetical protein